MSNKPHPVASITAILCERWFNAPKTGKEYTCPWMDHSVAAHQFARLASDIVRFAPAVLRHSVQTCNGEMADGITDKMWAELRDLPVEESTRRMAQYREAVDAELAKRAKRQSKRIAALNAQLASMGLFLCVPNLHLVLKSNDASRPLEMGV